MAINYPDYMPSYTMGETEEERRRREEEEAARAAAAQVQTFPVAPVAPVASVTLEPIDLANTEVQSTQVKTYGDGSQEETVKRQIPAAPPAAPVQPEVQAQPQPQPQAQPQMTPAPQPQAAVAPQQTTDPAEIQRRQQAMRAMIAQSQQQAAAPQPAAPAPTQAVAPTAMPARSQPPVPGPGVQVAGPAAMPPAPAANLQQVSAQMGAGAAPAPAPTFESRFTAAATDPVQLLQLRQDATLTKEQRQLAGRQAQQILNQEMGRSRGEQEIAGMDESQLARVLKSKSEEGSWAKMILLGFISPELAGKEAVKLGLNDKWVAGTDATGTPILYKTRDGVPIEGYDAVTDKPLTAKQLVSAVGTQMGKQISTTAETYLDSAGNRYRSQTDEKGNARLVNIATGQRFAGDATKLQRQTDVSSMARVDYGLATDLMKKHSGNVLDMLKEYEMIKGALTPEGRAEFMQRYGYGTTVPAAGAATGTTTPAQPGVPGAATPQMPGAPATGTAGQRPVSTGGRPVSVGGVSTVPTGTGGRVGGGVSGQSISGMKAQQEIGVAGAKENIQVQGARAQSFNKILDEEVRPQAQAGDTVSSVRKQQFAIFDRPGVDATKLFGLYNAAGEGTGDQKLSIIRDIFGGVFKPEAEVSQRLAALNLTPQEKSALMEYNIANQKVNAATLKQNAGPGAVSDAEQRANREANVDITKVPALGAFNAMAQSQFDGDRARWKADWATRQPAQNALELDRAWRKENQRLGEMYRTIATERAKFIAANGGTTQAVQLGYKRFAVPEYDPVTESWKKTRPLGQIIGGQ